MGRRGTKLKLFMCLMIASTIVTGILGSVSLYVKVTEENYTVTFEVHEGIFEIESITASRGGSLILPKRFLKLEHSHIAYVLGCLRANTSKVGNIMPYLLTSLYNAALTIDNYYRAEVSHDMYGSG